MSVGVFTGMPKLKFKGPSPPWYPNTVASLNNHLEALFQPVTGLAETRLTGLTKNVVYTLQYLELLQLVDEDIALSAVLQRLNYKSFIVHGCAVIEATFYYLLLRAEKITKTEWETHTETTSSIFAINGDNYRNRVLLERRIKPKDEQMKFDAMIKKVEHLRLTGLGNDFHSNLPFLKGLRNRVHIHGIENSGETDYLKVQPQHYDKMRAILLQLLTSQLFAKPPRPWTKLLPAVDWTFLK